MKKGSPVPGQKPFYTDRPVEPAGQKQEISGPPETVFQLLKLMVKNLFTGKFWLQLLLFAFVGMLVTYIHTYIMVKIYDTVIRKMDSVLYDSILHFGDFNVRPPGLLVVDKNIFGKLRSLPDLKTIFWCIGAGLKEIFNIRAINVSLFWALSAAVLTVTASRIINFGPVRFLKEFFVHFPGLLTNILAKPGSKISIKFIGGFVVSLALGIFLFSPLVGILLAVNLFLSMSAGENSFLLLITKLVKSDLHRIFNKKAPFVFKGDTEIAHYNGMIFGFLFTGLVPLWTTKWANYILIPILATFVVIAFFNYRKKKDAESLTMLLAVFLGYFLIPTIRVLAHDGGWAESGGNMNGWLHNPGAVHAVRNGMPPGIFAGLTSVFGASLPTLIKQHGGWQSLVQTLSKEQKDQVKSVIRERSDKAQQEAAAAGSIWGMTKQTAANIGQEIYDTGKAGVDAVVDAGSAVIDTVGYIVNNPKEALVNSWEWTKGTSVGMTVEYIVNNPKEALANSWGWTWNTAGEVKDALVTVGNDIWQAGKDVWNDPNIIKDTFTGSIGTVKDAMVTVKDAVVTFVTDPKKVWKFIKEATGIQNFENSWDPNRSLVNRLGQVGIGVYKVYATITTAQAIGGAVKNGATKLQGKVNSVMDSVKNKLSPKVSPRIPVKGRPPSIPRGTSGSYSVTGKAPDLKGVTNKSQKFIQNTADEWGVQIKARPTTEKANAWLSSGKAVPKEELVKAKTLKVYDELLGGPKGCEGLVGYYKPKMPPKEVMRSLSKETQAGIVKQFKARSREYRNLADQMKNLEKSGLYTVKNGLVVNKNGKFVTGDVDIFDICNFDGKPLAENIKKKVIADLRRKSGSNVMHEGLMSWDTTGSVVNTNAKAKMIRDAAQEGVGKGLTSFNPLSKPTSEVFVMP